MIVLKYADSDKDEGYYRSDITTIIEACASQGYSISRIDAKRVWEDYSDMMCAGWMSLPDHGDGTDDIVNIVLNRTIKTVEI